MALTNILCMYYNAFSSLIPLVAGVMVVTAAVAYAIGALMPPDVKAKAISWAYNLLMGAFLGLIFFHVGLFIISSLLGVDPNAVC